MANEPQVKSNYDGSEIAIIGVACRFPGAGNPDEFWRNLRDGVESIKYLTEEELRAAGVDAGLLANPNYVKAASILKDIDLYDAAFFGYSPGEAELMDPQQRLFIELAWEAFENAGYNPETYRGLIGVFGGAKTNTYLFNISSDREFLKSLDSFQIALGNDLGCLATRVSYKFDLKGPSYAVHTACSTSLVAVHLACQSLLIDECQMAIAGGVTVNVPHQTGYLYQTGGILSPDGHCRPFDAEANGTVFGSGAGIVVLKRLEDALKDGDNIYAIIRGSATNNDGAAKASFTAPGVNGQTEVVLEAMANAGVDAESISYIEAHGTGTNLGDPIEVLALSNAFQTSTDKKDFCAIGSVKSNIGHLDAAAGISSFIKTVLALRHKEIPPSLHYKNPNPKIDFKNTPFYVNTKLSPWNSGQYPRRAGVSSFGFGSTNVHIILEEAPQAESFKNNRPWQLLVLSARSEKALETATGNLVEYFRKNPDVSLADVAYTLQIGRKAFEHRRAIVCQTVDDALRAITASDPELNLTGGPLLKQEPGTDTASEVSRILETLRQPLEGCPDLKVLLTSLGKLWVSGQTVDWSRSYKNEKRRRVPLPTYPFERKRYWIEAVEQRTATRTLRVTLEKNPDINSWFYIPVWKEMALSLPTVSKVTQVDSLNWLIFEDACGVGEAIGASLKKGSRNVIRVIQGKEFQRLNDDSYMLNPTNRNDYDLLLRELRNRNMIPTNIVHLWSISSSVDEARILDINQAGEVQKSGFNSLLLLAQTFGNQIAAPVKLDIISNNMQSVTGEEMTIPAKATLLGACRVIPKEYDNITCRSIDIILPDAKAVPERLIAALIAEVVAGAPEITVAYRNNKRLTQSVEPIRLNEESAGSILKNGGVYLITGGMGGIGFVLAEYLARELQAKLALLGRSELPPRPEWDRWLSDHAESDATAKKISKLRSLEQCGAEILTIKADVCNEEDMKAAIDATYRRFGVINGVIHAAGVAGGGVIQMKTPELANKVLAPKLQGTLILDKLFSGKKLDFLALCSSLQSTMGDFGQADYSAANAFLDAYALCRWQRRKEPVIAIDWDNWQEVGIAVNADFPKELQPWREEILSKGISSGEGIAVFKTIMGRPLPQVIISTQELDARIELANSIRTKDIMQELSKNNLAATGREAKEGPGIKKKILPGANLEQMMVGIWKKVLGVERVGVDDNFFDLGGNSLNGLQLVSEIKRELGLELAPVVIYEAPTVNALTRYIRSQFDETQDSRDIGKVNPHGKGQGGEGVARAKEMAIIGMACRFPGARNIDEFWNNLHDGVESITFFSDEELRESGIDPALLKKSNYVKAAPILDDVAMFDAAFFGYTPREAEITDPQHRIFLECVWEALENAGYDSEKSQELIGVYGGASISTYMFNLQAVPGLIDAVGSLQAVIGNDKDSLTTSVSYKLNLKGPSMAVQTFCSTSLVAIHLALQSLSKGECDLAVAGGVTVNVPQKSGYLFEEGGILSPDGHCRAFDSDANGMLFGSGAGVVVLKRLPDALADGDHIYAVIKGSAVNNDGSLKVAYTAPSVEGQAEVIVNALKDAGVTADTISYVEAHGTGTQMGDPIEITALNKAFRQTTDQKGFCAIGSVKTNIGHLDRAAGIAGLIKAALALNYKKIPASLNFKRPNAKIDFANSPFYVNTTLAAWETQGIPRRAGVSALGFGGTNAHIILEEAPATGEGNESRPYQLLFLSARTESALDNSTQNLMDYISRTDKNLADIAFSLQLGRREFNYRRMLVCRSKEDAAAALTVLDPQRVITKKYESVAPSVVFMFPGQEAPYAGIGRDLYQHEPYFHEQFDLCAEIFKPRLGMDLNGLLYTGDGLNQPQSALAVLFAVEYALAKLLMKWGIAPQMMIGDNTGEYVAACLSDTLTLEEIAGAWSDLKPGQGVDHSGQAVRFSDNIAAILEDPSKILVEVGPGTTLSSLVKHHRGGAERDVFSTMPHPNDEKPELAYLLNTIGQLWLAGIKIDWRAFYSSERRRRLPLPTYPFERQRYWIEPQETSSGMAGQTRAVTPPSEEGSHMFYTPSWTRSHLTGGSSFPDGRKNNNWLLFMDGSGLGVQMLKMLKEEKCQVTTVSIGQKFQKTGACEYLINPGRKEDYRSLLDELESVHQLPDIILHLWGCNTSDDAAFSFDSFTNAQHTGFYSLLYLGQSLSRNQNIKFPELWVVSRSANEIYGDEDLSPEKATMLGVCKGITCEIPGAECHFIDVVVAKKNIKSIAEQILKEVAAGEPDQLVALRGGYRWLPVFEPLPLMNANAPSPLRERGVYLITEGFEEKGFQFARYLAEAMQAKLILPETKTFPAREDWDKYLAPDVLVSEASALATNQVAPVSGPAIAIHDELSKLDDFEILKTPAGLEEALNEYSACLIYQYFASRIDTRNNTIYDSDELRKNLKIAPQFERFYEFFLSVLFEEGIISIKNNQIRFLKTQQDIADPQLLKDRLLNKYPEFKDGLQVLEHCAGCYTLVLSGEMTPLQVLYPKPGINLLMDVARVQNSFSNVGVYQKMLTQLVRRCGETSGRGRMRFLEIAASEEILLPSIALNCQDLNVEYHIAVTSKSIMVNLEKLVLQNGLSGVYFHEFDMTRDPASQGLDKYSFDIMAALDTIHATPEIQETLNNVTKLLKPGGAMFLVEATKTLRWVNMIWGLMDGWWSFRDKEFRENSPLLTPDKWELALGRMDFRSLDIYPFDKLQRNEADHSLIITQQKTDLTAPDYTNWLADINAKEIRAIQNKIRQAQELERAGAEVFIPIIDGGDGKTLREAVVDGTKKFGEIHGIICATGLAALAGARLQMLDESVCNEFFRSKISNLTMLQEIFEDKQLDFAICFSSIASFTGGKRLTAETASSLYIDSFVTKAKQRGKLQWTVINWDLWEYETDDSLRDKTLYINPEKDQPALKDLLAYAGLRQVIVSPQNPKEMAKKWNLSRLPAQLAEKEASGGAAYHERPELKNDYVLPQNEMEEKVLSFWKEVLGIAAVGVRDNFFDLGGDSLQATQLNSRIRNAFDVDLPLQTFFKAPTIAETAAMIEQLKTDRDAEEEAAILKMLEQLSEEEIEIELKKRGSV